MVLDYIAEADVFLLSLTNSRRQPLNGSYFGALLFLIHFAF